MQMRFVWLVAAITGFAAPAIAQDAAPAPAPSSLHLRCDGAGTVQDAQTTTANVFASNGRSATGSATTYSEREIKERVLIELADTKGRIRFPKALVPPINSGGSDGWWPFTELKVTDTEIIGRFRLNFLNKPSIRIDRIHGDIDVEGFAGLRFRGACEPDDQSKRKF